MERFTLTTQPVQRGPDCTYFGEGVSLQEAADKLAFYGVALSMNEKARETFGSPAQQYPSRTIDHRRSSLQPGDNKTPTKGILKKPQSAKNHNKRCTFSERPPEVRQIPSRHQMNSEQRSQRTFEDQNLSELMRRVERTTQEAQKYL
jgi:hypothetical protein